MALRETEFFGEPIHEAESLPFYQAYRMLENRLANLSYVEFGLLVFDDAIRIFETRPDEKGYLARLPGGGMLNQVGIAEAFSKESTPLESTLSRFRYAKADIERLTPQYRYVPFDSACSAHLWPQSAYPEYKVNVILLDEFGININEYDIAQDVEFHVRDLEAKGNSETEIKRIRNILDRRVGRNMDLLVRQNAIAEMTALRPSSYSEHKKLVSDLLKNLETMSERPHFEERLKRFVWLNILDKRKSKVDVKMPSLSRTKELGQLNNTIAELKRQLGCLEYEQEVSECVSQPQTESVRNKDDSATNIVKPSTQRRRGKTQINIFLEQLCQEQDIDSLSGESLVSAIKKFVQTKNSIEQQNCPVKKHHGCRRFIRCGLAEHHA